jgi:hypothetical protein
MHMPLIDAARLANRRAPRAVRASPRARAARGPRSARGGQGAQDRTGRGRASMPGPSVHIGLGTNGAGSPAGPRTSEISSYRDVRRGRGRCSRGLTHRLSTPTPDGVGGCGTARGEAAGATARSTADAAVAQNSFDPEIVATGCPWRGSQSPQTPHMSMLARGAPPAARPSGTRTGRARRAGPRPAGPRPAGRGSSIKAIRIDQGQTHAEKRSNHVPLPLIDGRGRRKGAR